MTVLLQRSKARTALRPAQGERILNMTDLTNLTVAQIRDGHRAGDFSAVEVAQAFSANVAGAKALNAFIVATPGHALDRSAEHRVGKEGVRTCRSRCGP